MVSHTSHTSHNGRMTHMSYVELINFNDTMLNDYTAEKNQATLLFSGYLDIMDIS